jgi:hypothetical protein
LEPPCTPSQNQQPKDLKKVSLKVVLPVNLEGQPMGIKRPVETPVMWSTVISNPFNSRAGKSI